MKKYFLFLVFVGVFVAPLVEASVNFLGAPVMPGGKVLASDEYRLEKEYHLSYDRAVKFYQQELDSFEHVKFWDRDSSTYIEDHSNRPWHSITIEKLDSETIKIVILKDNWTWIIGTLVLRFIAVFVVLLVLYVAMSISGTIISKTVKTERAV